MPDSANATRDAIAALRAGRCPECGQQRVSHEVERSAGFGQGMKKEMIFVCGNPQCPNQGKS